MVIAGDGARARAGDEAARHPIRVVARRTGLKADLIRAWERRYQAVRPVRSESNERLYSDHDIARLVLLRRLTGEGHKISAIAALEMDELQRLEAGAGDDERPVRPAAPAPEPEAATQRVQEFIAALDRMETGELNAVLERAAVDLGPRQVVVEVVAPLVGQVLRLGDAGQLRMMHVHLARAVVQGFLNEVAVRGFSHPESAPQLVVATPAGGESMAAHVMAAVAACEGWRVTSLGRGLPPEEIVAAARQIGARCVVLAAAGRPSTRLGSELARLRRLVDQDVAVLVAGLEAEPSSPVPWPDKVAAVAAGRLGEALAGLEDARARREALHPHPTADGDEAVPQPLVLHVCEPARQHYTLPDDAFGTDGCLVVDDLNRLRGLVQTINQRREVDRNPERGITAGQLQAAALMHDFAHRLVERYDQQLGQRVVREALDWLHTRHGRAEVGRALRAFLRHYGYRHPRVFDPNRATSPAGAELILEEMVAVWLANQNPALAPVADLVDDGALEQASGYRGMVAGLAEFFAERPGFGAGSRSLFSLLCLPFVEAPASLSDQLEVLIRLEGELSGGIVERLLLALDILREENRPRFEGGGGPAPKPAAPVVAFDTGVARFSPQQPWMGSLVLAAKHTLVWLHQLSRRFGRPVTRLDAVPGEALQELAARGINGLWLVGLWQRSRASARIKQLSGNPEAAASAYALSDYRIAEELGGDAALAELERRAAGYGIRLGCDVVANHMGLDSPWVLNHPQRFISLPASPFPGYTFSGEDLSPQAGVGLFLADQYFDRSDAAVVFKRLDRRTGEESYIYHGNDGTSLPWNDTAQLDYLNPDTREAMIDTIVKVAKRFPIIRFDAAMVLAKRHIQRLWYPPVGAGGAIPSRSGRGMTEAEFESRMPEEFWRQVVERVVSEAPDTMLIAEAFWLLEGYFVRSLGLHRVYNSAFMHMLRDEDNAALRGLLRHWLEVDPETLGRFVNFMTTPDEQPAVEQFGRGDKFFGTSALLATLPGTPLFGHGQVEGLGEKYGMEYRRAYVDEAPDSHLVARHEREIVPLLGLRHRLADGTAMRLLDCERPDGSVDENVIAFVSGRGPRAVLVLMHNHDSATSGRLQHAAPARDGSGRLVREDLGTILALPSSTSGKCRLRDRISGRVHDLDVAVLRDRGLELELGSYEYRVLEPVVS